MHYVHVSKDPKRLTRVKMTGPRFGPRSTPAGARTQTLTILSRLPLPIGLPGRAGALSDAPRRCDASADEATLRRFVQSNAEAFYFFAVAAFGRVANSSNAARGSSRAMMPIMSRFSKKARIQFEKMRILRSQVGMASPW